ncbi:hypothetical protein DSO57_1033549 [Entomophthora muscae]|uniref:Uncharacterized protein n=1 Tax=Entomophthora muscae TaxID=34485 RepID=A0ACC2TBD6_9FUNG|nr:hypothetical protein DSO57_1033549 [Entomophthora muscae]
MLLWLIQLLPYFVFAVYQFSLRSPGPPAPLPAVFCLPGVPFGPIHFTDYPLKPKYKDYTPEKILKIELLACIQSAIRYNCQGLWIFSTPKLFRGKFNYLLAYNIYMEPPIENSFPLETQAQEQDSNPNPGYPWATGPVDCSAACLCFFGIKPLQAEAPAKPQSQNTSTSSTMVAPEEEPLKFPNGGRDDAYVNFMILKSSQVTNQEPTQERGTGPRPDPMTTTLEQDNQVAELGATTNERTPRPSAILLPLDPSTQFPQPSFPQCPDESPMENFKFGGGVLYRPKDPALQTYCHF